MTVTAQRAAPPACNFGSNGDEHHRIDRAGDRHLVLVASKGRATETTPAPIESMFGGSLV
jgi:hypothetical protein